jgi:hypothetical protein
MRGTILGVHSGRGVLIGPAEQRLEFPISEWRSAGIPAPGQIVDFVEEGGEARGVFAVPGASMTRSQSGSFVMGVIALVCLALGFIIPLLPTVAAFVLGVIGAAQAKVDGDDSALIMSRIAWITALVLLLLGAITLLALFTFLGTMGMTAMWHDAVS